MNTSIKTLWLPHVVVAGVIEREGRYLLVEEEIEEGIRINQPAGHWDEDESLIHAVSREVVEETGYAFNPTGILGFYIWKNHGINITYLRIAFTGLASPQPVSTKLDPDTRHVHWWTQEQMHQNAHRLRSPLVMKMVEDLKVKTPLPLSTLDEMREFY